MPVLTNNTDLVATRESARQSSDDEKVVTFVAFSVECYKTIRFVRLECSSKGAKSGFVSTTQPDARLFAPLLKGKMFSSTSRALANFVIPNRKKSGFSHDLDLARSLEQLYLLFRNAA